MHLHRGGHKGREGSVNMGSIPPTMVSMRPMGPTHHTVMVHMVATMVRMVGQGAPMVWQGSPMKVCMVWQVAPMKVCMVGEGAPMQVCMVW